MSFITKSSAITRAANLRRVKRSLTGIRVPKVYDRDSISRLLRAGLSIGQVAKVIGCSHWPVQQVRQRLVADGILKGVIHAKNSEIEASEQTLWDTNRTWEADPTARSLDCEPELVSNLCGQIHSSCDESD